MKTKPLRSLAPSFAKERAVRWSLRKICQRTSKEIILQDKAMWKLLLWIASKQQLIKHSLQEAEKAKTQTSVPGEIWRDVQACHLDRDNRF